MALALAAVALAGCGTPTEGARPDRPSVVLPPRLVDGERIDLNASVVVSSLPEQAAPVLSPDRPMDCFDVETDTGERTFLGGAVLELAWTPSTAATAELTVTASNLPAGSWRTSGPSPLRLQALPSDDQPVELPLHVEVVPAGAGGMELGSEQEAHLHVVAGLLESLIDSLVVTQASCG
jgi:hypothetical protein